MPRSRLGPLAIESKLGDHPSLSCVWRAVHIGQKRSLAVKIFSSPFGVTPETKAEFAAEWDLLKPIRHPAIARCYGGGFDGNEAYLAYELIEGETLSSMLERRTRLPWETVLDAAETLVDGLVDLHGRGIVHGRIVPDKIIFGGLSPVLVNIRANRATSPLRTSRPPSVAELALAPPQWIEDPTAITPQADLYCLGAVMYLAITGKPPIDGDSIEEVSAAVRTQTPQPPATRVMDCPVWLDKLIMQLLEKDPAKRPHGAAAVKLQVAEVRRRAMSKAGVAELTSAGFSPLNVNDQRERVEARDVLGRGAMYLTGDGSDEVPRKEITAWHDQALFLIAGLILVAGLFAYLMWPLTEDQMRARAEDLLAEGTRRAAFQAKKSYLVPLANRNESPHADWAREQIDRVEMEGAEHALTVKLNRNLPLRNEGERLYAEANRYERFGDDATALDQYRSMVTLFEDDPKYRPFVNLARRQIAKIESGGLVEGEAAQIIQQRLDAAEVLWSQNKVIAARKIWYSVVELYGKNANVAPLVAIAQRRLENQVDIDQRGDTVPAGGDNETATRAGTGS